MTNSTYLQKVAKEEVLSTREERELFDRFHKGEEKALEQIVKANLKLVVSVAKKYVGKGLPFDDLVQEGNIGLIKACKKYDPARGVKLSTYATWWISQAIRKSIADKSRTIRVPLNIHNQGHHIRKEYVMLGQDLGRSPSTAELADALDSTIEEVETVMQALSPVTSLYRNVNGDSEILDFIADDSRADELAIKTTWGQVVENVIEELPSRKQKIIISRYGIKGEAPRTLVEVGEELGVTWERVRQLQNEALAEIKLALASLYIYEN